MMPSTTPQNTCLIIWPFADSREVEGAVSHQWGDEHAPSPLDFNDVVVIVPPDDQADSDTISELRVALKAGVRVLLVVTPESSLAAIARLTATEVDRMNHHISMSRVVALDDRFTEYLSRRSHFTIIIRPSTLLEPIAYVGTPQTAIAVGPTAAATNLYVLPGDVTIASTDISSLIEAVRSPRRKHADERTVVATIIGVLLLIVVAALAITSARLVQRNANLAFLHGSNNLDYDYTQAALLEKVAYQDISLVELMPLEADTLTAYRFAESPVSALELTEALGLMHSRAEVVRMVSDAYSRYEGGRLNAVTYELFESAWTALRERRFERSRYEAQRFVNFIHSFPAGAAIDEANLMVGMCRKLVALVSDNYLYSDSALVTSLGRFIIEDNYYDPIGEIAQLAVTDSSLIDDAKYAVVAQSEQSAESLSTILASWQSLLVTARSGRVKELAEFNLGRSTVAALGRVSDEATRAMLRRQAIRYFDGFLATHRSSYLADDALLFIVRMYLGNNQSRNALMRGGMLYRQYPDSDATKRMRYMLRTFVEDSLGITDGNDVASFVERTAIDASLGLVTRWPVSGDTPYVASIGRLAILGRPGGKSQGAIEAAAAVLARSLDAHWPETNDSSLD